MLTGYKAKTQQPGRQKPGALDLDREVGNAIDEHMRRTRSEIEKKLLESGVKAEELPTHLEAIRERTRLALLEEFKKELERISSEKRNGTKPG